MTFTRYRRPSAIGLLTVGTALAATATAGLMAGAEGGLVLLLGLHEHVVLLGWLALAALTGAVLLGLHRRSPLRLPLLTTLLVVGVPMLLLGSFVSAVFGESGREEKTEAAPGRSDRLLVVEAHFGWLDPISCVYVHEGSRPLARRWTVGCFNGDAENNILRETVWTAPDRIRMTTKGGEVHEVTVAPGGRPDRTVNVGW